MKTALVFCALFFSSLVSAETCTSVIRDRSGYEWETFTRTSYSQQAACDQAIYDCHGALSFGQSVGRYYNAFCEISSGPIEPQPTPAPYPDHNPIVCRTDLVDIYNQIVRIFSAPGASEFDACNNSDRFCKYELSRNSNYGFRCITRGLIGNRNEPRMPERTRTEQCSVNRLDPAGMFIQNYIAFATGPINSDVRGEACRSAYNQCSMQLRGRQTCNIAR